MTSTTLPSRRRVRIHSRAQSGQDRRNGSPMAAGIGLLPMFRPTGNENPFCDSSINESRMQRLMVCGLAVAGQTELARRAVAKRTLGPEPVVFPAEPSRLFT